MRVAKLQKKKGQQEEGQRKGRTAFCSCCLGLGDHCGFRSSGKINFAIHDIWADFWHSEVGEEAGGSGGPAFPVGPSLKLSLGMEDKHGATQAACPLDQAHVTTLIYKPTSLSDLLIKADTKTSCVSYHSSLCRKIASLIFLSQKKLEIHIFPRVGMWKGNFILRRRRRELHVPGTFKDALTSSGGWGPGGSK